MQWRMLVLLFTFRMSAAVTIVETRKADRESLAKSIINEYASSHGSKADAAIDAQIVEGDMSDEASCYKPWHCNAIVTLWVIVACCGFPIQHFCGPELGNCCQLLIVLSCVTYAHTSGLWDAWYSGAKLGFACQLSCWLVFFQIAIWICSCACLCCAIGAVGTAAVIIKNRSIKKMHQEYEDGKERLSGPRREYFESDLFKWKCDALFDEFDKDKNGSLDMSELQPIIVREFGDADPFSCHILNSAFNENGDSKVEKSEFMHMMQYISMKKFNPGDFTEEAAWEVLQLNPKTATHSDVKKAYRDMCLKYHPDKRTDGTKEERQRDMQEINDAKAMLDKKFGH